MLRDWLPLVAVILAYDLLRGVADGLLVKARETPQIRLEAFLFGRPVPTVRLQEHLWHGPDDLRWWDYADLVPPPDALLRHVHRRRRDLGLRTRQVRCRTRG